MSAPGPESIPLSADPRRSARRPPAKKLKTSSTPTAAQAANLEALFAHPEQEIRLPPAPGTVARRALASAAPPEIVANVQGSSAGAGSGEFHVYKAARRREYERLRAMDEDVALERAAADFAAAQRARLEADAEKTRKNREKRERKKNKAGKGKGGGGQKQGGGDGTAVANGGGGGGKSADAAAGRDEASATATADGEKSSDVGGGNSNSANTNNSFSSTAASRRGGQSTGKTQSAGATAGESGLIIHDDD
ncbi:hypothetical protein B0T26DRAFT_705720 [Lasiosphaeria miniovina]|uniref:PRKR-interacting protein 1 n=1 Tax=Lasiosphaeria miniovina TaxID=1954250 RepID=A0AA40AW93_9PEZI|nr:uncharacterized protein B0T26DRAFT_705720 [Lasiosphaeria miniovina]KAK0723193.1 hypothetical protein B0T26DRAFT_705720 [Lasiosphaeria miniovina]